MSKRQSTKVERTCEVCGKKFFVKQCEYLRSPCKTCSRECDAKSRENTTEDFWRYVIKTGNQCWGWSGSTDKDGYGRMRVGGVDRKAHRLSWEIHFGPVPQGKQVLHKCDTPPCTNPSCLFLGTHQDNMKDKATKGRSAKNSRAGQPKCKINEDQAIDIRAMRTAGATLKEICAKYPMIAISTACSIARGARWKNSLTQHVP